MKVGELKVKFYHNTESNSINIKKYIKHLKTSGYSVKQIKEVVSRIPKCFTKVQIFRGEELLVESTAYCSLEDNFSRAVGRRLAVSKAVKSPSISDDEGFNIWNELNKFPSHIKMFGDGDI